MTKDQFEQMIRLMGADENTVQFGLNAFEMGAEHERYTQGNASPLFPRGSNGRGGSMDSNNGNDGRLD